MKVATFNIKNKTAKNIFNSGLEYKMFLQNARAVLKADPDVIALQEVTKKEYGFLKDFFGDKYDIYGEYRGSLGASNEACPIMVKKEIGSVERSVTYSISSDINKLGKRFFGAMFPRIATDIYLNTGKERYHITNVHIDNIPFVQKRSFDENGPLEKILYKDSEDSDISIQLGDFNCEIVGYLKQYCLRNDLYDLASPLGKTYKPLGKAIDHILCNDAAYGSNAVFYDDAGSDHYLIMTDVLVKGV